MGQDEDLQHLRDRALNTANRAFALGTALSRAAARSKNKRMILRIVNVFVGAVVFAVTLIPDMKSLQGSTTMTVVAVIAGVTLIIDALSPFFLGPDPED